ncbi:MAG: AEC family transporter [Lachnospiraceae bacterium]|nr:AEC family transporter [Candidatus Equihabitans merdae]
MVYLILGFKVILPIIIYMGIGYFFKMRGTAQEKTFRELNKMCFRSFLPIMLFGNIYKTDLAEAFEPSVLGFGIAAAFVTFFLGLIVTNMFFRGSDAADRSVMIQGLYRSNFILFGLEVTKTICGEENCGMASILMAIIIPLFNVMAVVLFESYGGKKKGILPVLKGIATNPLIIASALAILLRLTGVELPAFVLKMVNSLSAVATPVALLCLGGTFTFASAGHYRKQLTYVCLGRLFIIPAIFVAISILLGFRDNNLVALLVMFASPAAVSSYTMACEMGGNGELAGDIVVITSVSSIVSIFLWVTILSACGLIPA